MTGIFKGKLLITNIKRQRADRNKSDCHLLSVEKIQIPAKIVKTIKEARIIN